MTPTHSPLLPRRCLALLLPLTLLLGACGFQLRGSYDVPEFLTAVSLKLPMNSGALSDELRLELERKHISANGGDVQLEVTFEHLNRQASTLDSRARVAEYVLVYTVNFRFNSSDGRVTGPVQALILRRNYQYSTENVVGKTTEEETLASELRADAAQQIVRQLAALPISPAPAPESATPPPPHSAPAGAAPATAPAPAVPARSDNPGAGS